MKFSDILPIKEGVYDPHIFKAIFTSGAPGSGKSTLVKKLLSGTGLKLLDIDKWWEYFNLYKKDKAKTYDDYWHYIQAQRKNYIEGRLGLIIDGTGKDLGRLIEIKDLLEKLGYDTAMIFVNTSLETALARAKERERQTGRAVPRENIIRSWHATQENLGRLQDIFGGKFLIVDNNEIPANLGHVEKTIKRFLDSKITNDIARHWIQQELEKRKNNLK